ncbi:MAG TPA: mechanosensitive ion channel family protein [Usitatibacter sp.]|nr:mechanosensitive ion channel family protein [Usitatibacter sp.]
MNSPLQLTGNPWLDVAMAALAAVAAALIVHGIGAAILARVLRARVAGSVLVRRMREPARWALILAALGVVLESAVETLPNIRALRHFVGLLFIGAITWIVLAAIEALVEIVALLNPSNIEDNLHARRIRTQVRVLGRTLKTFATIFGIAAALITFPAVRQFGATLLASAGLAGLVAGFAARPVLGNLIAGLQIAFTQPIRIDDVLIVENEWARVEEITGAYVVLKIWDERRLVVPLQWFIEHPFQNWTRTSSQIIGTVFLWVDYRLPIEPIREEFMRLCKAAPEWDQRVAVLQVTELGERAMQLRGLASSADAGKNWDLRCRLREGLIEWLQREYPESLPLVRSQAQVKLSDDRASEPGNAPASDRAG